MVVAVTYDKETGNIGEHFGHAEYFKLYEIVDDKIVETAVVTPFGQGHDAVVYTMVEYNVTLVICGSIGDGAVQGLMAEGIYIAPGMTGSADAAIEDLLHDKIQVISTVQSNCAGHGSCCGGEGGSCGSDSNGCGCGSGCCH